MAFDILYNFYSSMYLCVMGSLKHCSATAFLLPGAIALPMFPARGQDDSLRLLVSDGNTAHEQLHPHISLVDHNKCTCVTQMSQLC